MSEQERLSRVVQSVVYHAVRMRMLKARADEALLVCTMAACTACKLFQTKRDRILSNLSGRNTIVIDLDARSFTNRDFLFAVGYNSVPCVLHMTMNAFPKKVYPPRSYQ